MAKPLIGLCLMFFTAFQATSGQVAGSNTLQDFVKGLTSLISENGGLGSLVNAVPHLGHPPGGYPPPPGSYPIYAPGYPTGAYDDELRPYRPHYRPPPYRPFGRPPAPGYYPPPALPPGLYPGPGQYQPQQGGFLAALGSIARHDELRCVPRLLCEVTSGGKPGYPSSTLGVQQTTRDTITTLLTAVNYLDDNPLFVFGRAALLGAASRGNSVACLNAFPTCPRDPDQLVHYLNNHNGGFFRFFGGLPGQQRGNGEKEQTGQEDGEGRIQTRPSYQAEPAIRYPTRQPHSFLSQSASYLRPAVAQDYLPISAHGGDLSSYGSPNEGKFVFPSDKYASDNRYPSDDRYPSANRYPSDDRYPSADRYPNRGGKQLAFPTDSTRYSGAESGAYKPDYSPPQNLINFRDQRSIKFPKNDGKMSFPGE